MIDVAGGWELGVERGPDWLFVKVHALPEGGWQAAALAESLWSVIEQHFTYRVVLECDQIGPLTSSVLAQLALLRRKIRERGGVLRLCGLSKDNCDLLADCGAREDLPHFADRESAVMAGHPRLPR
ncbi:MAG: hypothetical protein HYX69_22025 [Planctomycetia bacterium]|nr:hypothetical protein [Planctomycetia bacterium]